MNKSTTGVFDQKRLPASELAGLSMAEVCDKYGLASFDFAKPQPWLDFWAGEWSKSTGEDYNDAYDKLRTGCVWCYEAPFSVCGAPFFFSVELDRQMAHLREWG